MIKFDVDSSWLKSLEFVATDDHRGFIYLYTTAGDVLCHGPIESSIFGEFLAATSKGKFYNQVVRNYPYWKRQTDGSFQLQEKKKEKASA